MPSAPTTLDSTAAAELRGAAVVVARHLPDGHPRRFILSAIGDVLEGGDTTTVCALCRRPFAYDRAFFTSRGLCEPRRCFGCRVLTRGR
jgi:hypothetical protein